MKHDLSFGERERCMVQAPDEASVYFIYTDCKSLDKHVCQPGFRTKLIAIDLGGIRRLVSKKVNEEVRPTTDRLASRWNSKIADGEDSRRFVAHFVL